MAMNTSQARVADPVLTNHARGYRHPKRVGGLLFPRVDCLTRGGKRVEFDKTSFRRMMTRRAPGGNVKELELGYKGEPFELYQDALAGKVPIEHYQEAREVPGIDLGMSAVSGVMDNITLQLEIEQGTLAQDTSLYADSNKLVLAGNDQWSAAGSNPIAQVDAAREVIRRQIGMYPNVAVIGPRVFTVLKEHAAVVDRVKNVSKDSITPEVVANLLSLEALGIGEAVYLPDDAGEDDAFTDVWGNTFVLAYAPQKPSGLHEPAFGYTYTLKGHPLVEAAYYHEDTRSWKYPVVADWAPLVTGAVAGFLFTNVIAEA